MEKKQHRHTDDFILRLKYNVVLSRNGRLQFSWKLFISFALFSGINFHKNSKREHQLSHCV